MTFKKSSFASLFLSILPILIAAWVYLPAVAYPFFWDDPVHIRYVDLRPTEDIFTTVDVLPYYRPLVNWMYQLAWRSQREMAPPFLHLVVIYAHLLNIALVGTLARLLRLNRMVQFAAMLIFALFPFSFQAVIWITSSVHPLTTFAVLLTCTAGIRFWRNPEQRKWLLLAWGAGIIAPFIHENGILTAAFLGMVLILMDRQPLEQWRRFLLLTIPVSLSALVYLYIRARLSQSENEPRTLDDIRFNLAFFAQGLSFPFQLITGHVASEPNLTRWVWYGFIPFLFGLGLVTWRSPYWRVILISLGWFAVSMTLATILLAQTYVISSPRLLYFSATGIALLYALWLERGWQFHRAIGAVMAGTGLVVLILSVMFIRDRMRLHEALDQGYRDLIAELDQTGNQTPVLVVNSPAWLDSEDLTFPVGKMGAIFRTDYFGLNDYLFANSGTEYPNTAEVIYYPALDPWNNHLGGLLGNQIADGDRAALNAAVRSHAIIISFQVAESADNTAYRARVVGERFDPGASYVADFAGAVRLHQAEFKLLSEGWVRVRLDWHKLNDDAVPYIAFVHLLCDGMIIAQIDAAPIDNLYPFSEWAAGEAWTEYRYLFAGTSPESCLSLRVGMYDPATGEHAPVEDASGQPVPDGFLIME